MTSTINQDFLDITSFSTAGNAKSLDQDRVFSFADMNSFDDVLDFHQSPRAANIQTAVQPPSQQQVESQSQAAPAVVSSGDNASVDSTFSTLPGTTAQMMNSVPQQLSPGTMFPNQQQQQQQQQNFMYHQQPQAQQHEFSPLPSNAMQQQQQSQQLYQQQQQQAYNGMQFRPNGSPMSMYEQASMLTPPAFSPPHMNAQSMLYGQQTTSPNGFSLIMPRMPTQSPPMQNTSPLFGGSMQMPMQLPQAMPGFMGYDPSKYQQQMQQQQQHHQAIMPYGMQPYYPGYRQKRGLTSVELQSIFLAANGHPSGTRSKRDLAIICLIIDLHLSSGTITRLTMRNVPSILRAIEQGDDINYEGHVLEAIAPSNGSGAKVACHPLTAWALTSWVSELINVYRWGQDQDAFLFVNSQPLYNTVTGEKSLRKAPLKRDAISKVFQSIKQRSGVNCHKSMISSSSLKCIGNVYPEWIKRLEQDWADKE